MPQYSADCPPNLNNWGKRMNMTTYEKVMLCIAVVDLIINMLALFIK